MGLFDKVQISKQGCVGILNALLNAYQDPEPAPEPEFGSEEEPETCNNVYVDYIIPENDIQYPGEITKFRLILPNETTNEAITKAKQLLNTTIGYKKVAAFVLFISKTNKDDKRIYLKSNYDNIIEQNPSSNTTVVYSFDKIPLPE